MNSNIYKVFCPFYMNKLFLFTGSTVMGVVNRRDLTLDSCSNIRYVYVESFVEGIYHKHESYKYIFTKCVSVCMFILPLPWAEGLETGLKAPKLGGRPQNWAAAPT